MESEEDTTPEDKVARIKEQRQAEMNALIAARLVRQYAKIEQKVGSNYQRPDFKSEIEAAREGRTMEIQESVGARYEKPDFKSEIEAAREGRNVDVQEFSGARYEKPDFKSEIKTAREGRKKEHEHESSNHHAVDASTNMLGSCTTTTQSSKQSTKAFGSYTATTHSSKQGVQSTNKFGSYTSSTTQVSDDKSYTETGTGGADPVELSGRYNFTGICLFEFTAALDDEITIHPGDQITQIHQFDKNWLWGTNPKGKAGRFPKSYVEIFEEDAKEL